MPPRCFACTIMGPQAHSICGHASSPHQNSQIPSLWCPTIPCSHSAVENIPILLHAQILLFPSGLVEFLFNLNGEVVHVVLRTVPCFLSIIYILLIAHHSIPTCPFQTSFISAFWYITHIITITSLFPFSCSSHALTKAKEPWNDTISFDTHILNVAPGKRSLTRNQSASACVATIAKES